MGKTAIQQKHVKINFTIIFLLFNPMDFPKAEVVKHFYECFLI